jgi:hypothetical protein
MIYLQTNTPTQQVFLSLDEARQYFATPFTNYLLVLTHEENSTTGNQLAQVATIVNENTRITQLEITTVKRSCYWFVSAWICCIESQHNVV